MKHKGVRSFLIVLTLALLLLVSCGPKAPATSAPTPTPARAPAAAPAPGPSPAPAPAPAPTSLAEKPKYGGILNVITVTDLEVFSPAAVPRSLQMEGYVYEQFLRGDWSKGPSGTGETAFTNGPNKFGDLGGWLAESYETPEIGVWILNIRKGVHYALDPNSAPSRLVNGREMTADDAKWSIDYLNTTPTSWITLSQPALAKNTTVEKTGPWQITVKTPVDPGTGYCWIMGGGGSQYVWPQEAVEKYGKTNDWHQTLGTGPYMLTDFVPGSVATFKRNPNYWGRNLAGNGKGDQLPYPDGLKYLIVPDLSTRIASIRTGKADLNIDTDGIEGEDARSLIKTSPKLQYVRFLPGALSVTMRTDKQDLPYKDVRVRQALMLATDFQALKNDLYGGDAEILTNPISPEPAVAHIYVPLEKLPESARSLFTYNPARAKQLLADAGYPNGFKAKMIVQNTSSHMDSAAAFKAMWAKAGIDVELQPREAAVYRAINAVRSHEDMIFRTGGGLTALSSRYVFSGWRSASTNNPSYINDPPGKDPVIEAAYQDIQKNIFINYPKADQLIHDLIPYILEQANYITRPTPYSYRIWQPWVKNYHGESGASEYLPFLWIDQDLKEQITGRR